MEPAKVVCTECGCSLDPANVSWWEATDDGRPRCDDCHKATVAGREPAMKWRPIATAPHRDGERVVLTNGESCYVGYWMAAHARWYTHGRAQPTHWIDLPPLPPPGGPVDERRALTT